jgi:glycosylphosphatidylinositol transamidase (GPIT) subunit GPI8
LEKALQNICEYFEETNLRAEVTNNIVILKFQNKQEINNQYNIRQIKLICEFLANVHYKKTTISCKLTVQLYLISYCTGSS